VLRPLLRCQTSEMSENFARESGFAYLVMDSGLLILAWLIHIALVSPLRPA
jgi:hypothetical protein